MIALDTNILLRLVLRDDAAQASAALRLMEKSAAAGEAAFVSLITLVEFAWVLEDTYGVSKNAIVEAIAKLLNDRNIVVEQESAVSLALETDHGDFSDRLIHFVGEAAGCERTVTFDRRFARLEGVELLKAEKA